MAFCRIGRRVEATELFERAVRVMDTSFPEEGKDEILVWWDWIQCRFLRIEAQSVIGIETRK
jgi:hypothetical protein